VARNKAIDRLRRDRARAEKTEMLAGLEALRLPEPGDPEEDDIPDDRLALIFTCCHPSLAPQTRVALTLRSLAGLTVEEVARAFLASEAAMAKRLVRAKQKIRHAGIRYEVPGPDRRDERLPSVLATLYLIFNEGYSSTSADSLVRRDLCAEAMRLTRVLAGTMRGETEVLGLLALMLLQDSRRSARVGPDGVLVLLEDQDRTLWNQGQIAEGLGLVRRALGGSPRAIHNPGGDRR